MKLYKLSLIALAMLGLVFAGCEPTTEPEPAPEPEPEVIPSSFPRKHLIEEFTGQTCGYCPDGMNSVSEFMANDTNFILVLHHAGYGDDSFTVGGSKTIATALGVNSAPNVTINRSTTQSYVGNKAVFHPGYLPSVNKAQFVDTTYASVNIQNTYNSGTRELKVVVSGVICKDNYPELSLTVLIKESGMIASQADYYDTFEGWKQFRHANAVRAFLTEKAKGDPITVQDNMHYEAQFVINLKEAWVPENCMVVAVLSEAFKPVIQAAQKPVVDGSKGGADITHGGITPVPVPDYYPEPNATDGPDAYTGRETQNMAISNAYYAQYPQYGFTYWVIQTYNTSATCTVNNTTCIPFSQIYLLTPYDEAATLPTGTFAISGVKEAGNIIAGYRQDEPYQTVGGSSLSLTGLSYFQQGYLDTKAEWLISDGQMVITEDGWTIESHARNGAPIRMTGPTLNKAGRVSSPARIQARVP